MSTVRDIITEAFNRANLVPRKRDLPADMLTSGLNLLKGVLQDFSNKKYIQAYKSEFDFKPTKEKTIVGAYIVKEAFTEKVHIVDNIIEVPEANVQNVGEFYFVRDTKKLLKCEKIDDTYVWNELEDPTVVFSVYPDIEIKDLMTPTVGLFKEANGSLDFVQMNFISYDEFYSAGYGDYIISWKPYSAGAYEIFVKPRFLNQGRLVKIIYNIVMDYKDNDVISLPTPYLELLTRALAYQVAVNYPRTDATKVTLLEKQYEELSRNLEASNASQRILTRSMGTGRTLLGSFLDGTFISDRWY